MGLDRFCAEMSQKELPISLNLIQTVAMDICLGMNYIHLCGFVHENMHLGNFIISDQFIVKVTGFVKKPPQFNDTRHQPNENFQAPEMRWNEHSALSDSWSYAIILTSLMQVSQVNLKNS